MDCYSTLKRIVGSKVYFCSLLMLIPCSFPSVLQTYGSLEFCQRRKIYQFRMLNSPKMQRIQRSVRINDGQLLGLAEKARWDHIFLFFIPLNRATPLLLKFLSYFPVELINGGSNKLPGLGGGRLTW